ncbi:hypothetical protein P692DRAFT_20879725 [Suillus brevipes Sb2]|nr:hypothetical protein P692DRAFT_20879725 [Suillus brevipes Sb2]
MSTCSIGNFSTEQKSWLDDHYAAYDFVRSQNDLSTFWVPLFANFLAIWPVRNTLWPQLPQSHIFSSDELRTICKAETRSKLCIQSFFDNKHRTARRDLYQTHIGDWTIEQWCWLNDYSESYSAAVQNDDLDTFFGDLFEDFFAIWPVRYYLWPSMPAHEVLSTTQRYKAIGIEEDCKMLSRRFAYPYVLPYHSNMRLIERVLFAKELVIAIVYGLNLQDLINIAQTCSTIRGVVLYLLEKYKHDILTPYISTEHRRNQFFGLLTATRGVITGSCALNMILGSPTYPTNDLNVIVPLGEFNVMAKFVTDALSFHPGSTTIHKSMQSTIQKFSKFNRLGAHITLAESKDKEDVLRVIVNSPTTADMSFMTPGGAATLYPVMTFQSIAYLTDRGHKMENHSKIGSISGDRFHIEQSTEFLGSPCLSNCPVLWR